MGQFDTKTLETLKKLCRIDCTPDEEADIIQSLNRVLDYVTQLKEVDTEGTPPCSFVLRTMMKNLMRDDIPKDPLSREQFLNNAPDQIGGMIRTPPVLKAQ